MNCACASRSTTLETFFKIVLVKTRWRLQVVEPAMVVKGRIRVAKEISDVKQYKKDRFRRRKHIFLEDKTFQSWLGVKSEAGLMKALATGN